MRTLLLILALALISAYAPPAIQTSAATIDGTSVTDVAAKITAKKKKSKSKSKDKKKKKQEKKLTVTLDEIGSVKKGRRGFEVTAHIAGDKGDVDYRCRLAVTYDDGTEDEPEDVTVDNKDVCTVTIDIPNDAGVVGEAEASLIVVNEAGKKKGSAKQKFEVRSGR